MVDVWLLSHLYCRRCAGECDVMYFEENMVLHDVGVCVCVCVALGGYSCTTVTYI